jgi:hypothetical protein
MSNYIKIIIPKSNISLDNLVDLTIKLSKQYILTNNEHNWMFNHRVLKVEEYYIIARTALKIDDKFINITVYYSNPQHSIEVDSLV